MLIYNEANIMMKEKNSPKLEVVVQNNRDFLWNHLLLRFRSNDFLFPISFEHEMCFEAGAPLSLHSVGISHNIFGLPHIYVSRYRLESFRLWVSWPHSILAVDHNVA